MSIELVLYQPDIPQNTGALLRLGACLGVRLHIIHPTGFVFSAKSVQRSALDYLAHVDFVEHTGYAAFDAWRRAAGRRLVLLTTAARDSAYATRFDPADLLMVGRESAGVPAIVAADADLRIRIPMRAGMRSLNVALAAALIVGEAKRQTDQFAGLS